MAVPGWDDSPDFLSRLPHRLLVRTLVEGRAHRQCHRPSGRDIGDAAGRSLKKLLAENFDGTAIRGLKHGYLHHVREFAVV